MRIKELNCYEFFIRYSMIVFLGGSYNVSVIAQDRGIQIQTEIGLNSTNEINVLASFPLAKQHEIELKLGWNFNSRLFSNACGILGIFHGRMVQEHQSMVAGILEANYLYEVNSWLRFGVQGQLRYGKADNIRINARCFGGGFDTDYPEEYDIDKLRELGLGLKIVFIESNKPVNIFISGGSKRRWLDITRREPSHYGKKEVEWLSQPIFNIGIKINIYQLQTKENHNNR